MSDLERQQQNKTCAPLYLLNDLDMLKPQVKVKEQFSAT